MTFLQNPAGSREPGSLFWSGLATATFVVINGLCCLGCFAQTNTSFSANSIPINGIRSIGIGWTALQQNLAPTNDNTAIGFASLNGNSTGIGNVAIGYESLRFNTTGSFNTALGAYALRSNTTGSSNAAMGYQAMRDNTTGSTNVAVGAYAMWLNTSGSGNTAIGWGSLLENKTGMGNVALGYLSLGKVTGSYNTGLGNQTLRATRNAGYNTMAGSMAGAYGEHGNENTFAGFAALNPFSVDPVDGLEQNTGSGSFTGQGSAGSRNVFLGYASGSGQSHSDRFELNLSGSWIAGDFAGSKLSIGHPTNQDIYWPGNRTLYVQRGILTDSLRVMLAAQWADHVFDSGYHLMPLSALEAYIKKHRRLPEMPSEAEVAQAGIPIGDMQVLLLKKIEELVLYIIRNEAVNRDVVIPTFSDSALESEIDSLRLLLQNYRQ